MLQKVTVTLTRNIFVVSLAIADLVVAGYPNPLVLTSICNNGWNLGCLHCQISAFLMGLSVISSMFNVFLVWILTLVAIVPNVRIGMLQYDPKISSHMFAQSVKPNKNKLKPQGFRNFITMFVVFVLLAICWAPLNFIGLAVASDPTSPVPRIPEWLSVASHYMAYFNSCFDAIIYGLLNQNFRKEYKRIIVSLCTAKMSFVDSSDDVAPRAKCKPFLLMTTHNLIKPSPVFAIPNGGTGLHGLGMAEEATAVLGINLILRRFIPTDFGYYKFLATERENEPKTLSKQLKNLFRLEASHAHLWSALTSSLAFPREASRKEVRCRFLQWGVGEELAADGVGTCFLAGFVLVHFNYVQFFSQEISVMTQYPLDLQQGRFLALLEGCEMSPSQTLPPDSRCPAGRPPTWNLGQRQGTESNSLALSNARHSRASNRRPTRPGWSMEEPCSAQLCHWLHYISAAVSSVLAHSNPGPPLLDREEQNF
ncbi:hypothetical protein MC885_007752, partial [Smutsia gigantea]